MNEIQFMRWLTSVGIYDEAIVYHNTCDPIRGYWKIEDDCYCRKIIIMDSDMNEVHKVYIDNYFRANMETEKEMIKRKFDLDEI